MGVPPPLPGQRKRLQREIAVLDRTVARLLDAVESGEASASLRERLAQREMVEGLRRAT